MALPASFWRGAAAGIAATAVGLSAFAGSFLRTGLPVVVEILAGAVIGLAAFVLGVGVARGAAALGKRLPPPVPIFLAAAVAVLALLHATALGWPGSLFYPAMLGFVSAQAILVGALWAWRRGEAAGRTHLLWGAVGALLFLVLGIAWLASDGRDPFPLPAAKEGPLPPLLGLGNPGERGGYDVESLTYGSGEDRRRPEYGGEADWTSETVDASKLLPEWKGTRAKLREWYWGFSLDEAPLNGRVWLPAGPGPFPLVLVVHGNHRMEEHSDPGYAYLGELLASRGFATVSVDENFVNGTWSGDFRGKEMPLRAWLLLEHLRAWRAWNRTPGHPVEGKVDLDRVALIGHSRGGEAVAIAAAFNRLPRFPDDATVAFDYGFGIRSLVAIAQIDARYPRRMKLRDVSFLALQGSYDSDEASFHGLRQLRRIDYGGEDYHFKAGVYLHRGNHGQFNTVWGRTDAGPPYSWLLNLAPIVPGETQREVARAFISAFLEATLHGELGYVPFFRDPRRGREWLPDAVLVSQFSDSSTTALASFEEDLDVSTATAPGARIEADGLSLWREEELLFRDDQKQGTSAVVLGWTGVASYALRFERGASFDPRARLTFFLSGHFDEQAEDGQGASPEVEIEIEDLSGQSAVISLDEVAPLAMPLRVQFLKLARWNRAAYGRTWEPTLQSYELPFEALLERNPALDLARVAAIRFRLGGEGENRILLDDLSVASPPSDPITAAANP